MKTSELTGAALDYWVARAKGWREVNDFGGPCWADKSDKIIYVRQYQPSTDWAQGGPLIAKTYGVDQRCRNGDLDDCYWQAPPGEDEMSPSVGDTPLQAICRAVVRAAFGDEVEEVLS